jgi:DNA polymerase-3 subunit delta'
MEWHSGVWQKLTQDLQNVPHAILIHGPKGVGKLALGKAFTQLLLCEKRGAGRACGSCNACHWLAQGNHPDFRLVQPEALELAEIAEEGAEVDRDTPARKAKPSLEIKVEQVRELGDFLHVGSHRGARRITLIHPAEAMNPNAANALLKALEEPPPAAIFLLVSHDPARLLPTVRSRCVRVAVPAPPQAVALAWMTASGVAEPERWLAYAGGAPLFALELAAGERSADRMHLMQALELGNLDRITTNDRESLELLAEVLQRRALDLALSAATGASRFQPGLRAAPASAARWLAFAREMGRNRVLARRPLNPRLFGAELLTRYAELGELSA